MRSDEPIKTGEVEKRGEPARQHHARRSLRPSKSPESL